MFKFWLFVYDSVRSDKRGIAYTLVRWKRITLKSWDPPHSSTWHPPFGHSALEHMFSPIQRSLGGLWFSVKMKIGSVDTFQTVICQPSKCVLITLNYASRTTLLGYRAGWSGWWDHPAVSRYHEPIEGPHSATWQLESKTWSQIHIWWLGCANQLLPGGFGGLVMTRGKKVLQGSFTT